jgi:hypothetical protein
MNYHIKDCYKYNNITINMAQKEKETGTNLDGLFCLGHTSWGRFVREQKL